MKVLTARTHPSWTDHAMAHFDEVLVDHAHCEKKAASFGLNLIFAYGDEPGLAAAVSPLVREEMAHFEAVLELCQARGLPFRKQVVSPYGAQLNALLSQNGLPRLVDSLLMATFIEARSTERLRLIGRAFEARGGAGDAELADFYTGLVKAEARHEMLYLGLAEEIAARSAAAGGPVVDVKARVAEFGAGEAEAIVPSVAVDAASVPARVHSVAPRA